MQDVTNPDDPLNFYDAYYNGTSVVFMHDGNPISNNALVPSTARFFTMDFFDPNSGTWENTEGVAQVSILNKAEELAQVIREITRITQVSDVIVVGHSMGGLVTRAYIENMASPGACYENGSPAYGNSVCLKPIDAYSGEIAELVTLDTPHGGADIAVLNDTTWFNDIYPNCTAGPSTTKTEMIPGSELLTVFIRRRRYRNKRDPSVVKQ